MTHQIAGQRFGKIVVIERSSEKTKYGHTHWICVCDCGNKVLRSAWELLQGRGTKCGRCFVNLKYDPVTRKPTATYRIWLGMLQRCNNPKYHSYPHYGGRGIKICQRWQNFNYFVEDMGERPNGMSIDRINNNGNYEPDNCRWATQKEQINNTRRVLLFDYKGTKKTLSELSTELNIKHDSLYYKLVTKKLKVEQLEQAQKGGK